MTTRLFCLLAISALLAALSGRLPIAHAQADPDAVALEIQAVRSADAVYIEHFRMNDGAWNTEASMSVVPYYQTGTLHIAVLDPETVGYSISEWEAGDFYLEVDSYYVGGPFDNEYGVIFRYVDELNFYYFSISSDGYYAFNRYVDGEWQMLIDWTASDVIMTGEGAANWLGLYAIETQFTLLVNDYILEIVEDNTFDYGGIGLAAGAIDEAGVAVAFDDLSLWDAHTSAALVPQTTATQLPTATIVPGAATPAPGIPATDENAAVDAIRSSIPTYTDDFSVETGDWPVQSNELVSYAYLDEMLHIRVLAQNRLGWSVNPRTFEPGIADFFVEVDVTDITGVLDSAGGLLFRYQDGDNYYIFSVSVRGTYTLQKRSNGEWHTPLAWTPSPTIRTGQGASNRIGVLAQGATISLFANDMLLATLNDSSLTQGGIAVVTTAYDEVGVEIAFDNFSLWSLAGSLGPSSAGQPTVAPTPTTVAAAATPTPVTAPPSAPEQAGIEDTSIEDIEDIEDEVATLRASNPTFSDEFRTISGRWTFDADGDADALLVDRALHVFIDEFLTLVFNRHDQVATDFYVEADIWHVGEPSDAEYGLVFRLDESGNYYSFTIDANGNYLVARQVDGDWEALIDWNTADALATGSEAVNRLGVLARDSRIIVFANDQMLAEVEDPEPRQGQVALMVGTFFDSNVEIGFDNFDLWDLSSAPSQ